MCFILRDRDMDTDRDMEKGRDRDMDKDIDRDTDRDKDIIKKCYTVECVRRTVSQRVYKTCSKS